MSAGSNLSGLQPLGAKKLPPAVKPETPSEMSAFDMVPDKSSRGQEMLSPLAVKSKPVASFDAPNPLLKASFGRNPNKGGTGLAPLGAPSRNLSNDVTDKNDPLLRSLKQKKKGNLAPMGIAQMNMPPSHLDDLPPQPSPIKCRVGANRIISPMAAKASDVPMHILGVSRTNLNNILRQPKAGVVENTTNGRKLLNLDGAFPDDDDFHKSADDFQKTLKDTNKMNETGHRMKNMLGLDGPSQFAREDEQGLGKSLRKSLRRQRQEPEHDPWSTTTGSTYIY
eukprot:CAMPEP_0114429312 /NCGR_PEP_ID=MMETSP0103-20121206/9411_1 /TAXON_ID=37642 ORGANISM="Paraphysomonas imperforata, Strain PA2" /NCGR_SAMPLE_ID=MMETSP0103 /ASSEMBLY_ACC=CAM_ASM_000201 /LENGTH=280 /DNA_ID=CAMNT_0001598625 /DNA_START=72 /DNA_END=914 /DNA_ORIENTATION=+